MAYDELGHEDMKKSFICLVIALGFAAQSGFSLPVTLTGTVRDFVNPAVTGYSAHPDFEGTIGGLQTGAIKNTLGVDDKPVWNTLKPGFTSQANFDQWYRDTAGVNVSAPLSLTLTEGPGGIYSYSSSAFFPIDNQLLGNQGRSHNFHFTFELHNLFTYVPGQTFDFTGDDDLWLFINDQLVVDLGGVHGALSSSVNLDTLGLTPGSTYNFDLFFAERHTSQSNFKVQTSILLRPTQVPEAGSTFMLLAVSGVALAMFKRK